VNQFVHTHCSEGVVVCAQLLQYTPGLYEIFRRDERCILKIRHVKADMNDAEFSCEVSGDETVCKLTVEGSYLTPL